MDASNGTTGVYVNKRQLTEADLMGLNQMGMEMMPGFWWLQADGRYGQDVSGFLDLFTPKCISSCSSCLTLVRTPFFAVCAHD